MLNKKTISALVKIAHDLDLEQKYNEADKITELLTKISQGNKRLAADSLATPVTTTSTPVTTTPDQTTIDSILKKALIQHLKDRTGWSVLRPAIKGFDTNTQRAISQQFMQQSGEYNQGVRSKGTTPQESALGIPEMGTAGAAGTTAPATPSGASAPASGTQTPTDAAILANLGSEGQAVIAKLGTTITDGDKTSQRSGLERYKIWKYNLEKNQNNLDNLSQVFLHIFKPDNAKYGPTLSEFNTLFPYAISTFEDLMKSTKDQGAQKRAWQILSKIQGYY